MSVAQPSKINIAPKAVGAHKLAILAAHLTWSRLALGSILALAVLLNFYRLDQNGFSNEYYAAAVKSMLANWHNFFFNSYDPGGFISLDKPPVAFWLQTASAWIFGYNGVSLLLPSAIAGVVSVALLYRLVERAFGTLAGLLAALALAVTPISVVMSRHNNPEGLLVLTLLLAVWATIRATQKGQLAWLIGAMVIMGIGFNIKMLEALIILPALYLAYLLLAPIKWWKRFIHVALAGVVLAVISLSWAVAVDLTPANQRPYIGSSGDNSVFSLIFGYNGLGRIEGNQFGGNNRPSPGGNFQPPTTNGQPSQPNGNPNFNFGGRANGGNFGGGFGGFGGGPTGVIAGKAGPLRLFMPDLAGEEGWLIPLALLGLILAAFQSWRRFAKPLRRQRWLALILWGGWLLIFGAVFSSAEGTLHSYYLVMLAPGIAALAGIGLEALWHSYQQRGWQGWLLPIALVGTALFQFNILSNYIDWNRTLILGVVGLELVCASLLVVLPRLFREVEKRVLVGTAALATLGLLAAPLAWSVNAILTKTYTNATLPTAVPATGTAPVTFGRAATNTGWLNILQTHWNGWLTALVVCVGVALLLTLGLWVARRVWHWAGQARVERTLSVIAAALVISLGLALASTALPTATVSAAGRANVGSGSTGIIGNPSFALSDTTKLIAFLEANRAGSTYLLATTTSENASPIIIQTGQAVMSLGGFMGSDHPLTSQELAQLVQANIVRYFLLDNSTMGGGRGGNNAQQPTVWVQQNCQVVNSQLWSNSSTTSSSTNKGAGQGRGFGGGSQAQLYDCAAA